MINKISVLLILFSLFSCIPVHRVKQVDNFRIELEDEFNDEQFLFKPLFSYGDVKRSLRKQFKLKNSQKLENFEAKLFDEFEMDFNVIISFEGDRSVTSNYLPFVVYGDEPEEMVGELEVFVKIKIFDSNGGNCLSTHSLFYDKTRSFLIHLKNNIKKEPLF
ncbi:hypothetical protein [Aquimarina aquimarini]|uniref:hypothetical protein n=1 Tax=Aquimarina aquimarini TaxID=1191734 RepID=UPI000D550535|nr:hypothetical protein [Aquimarina aquimarini]